MFAANGPIIDAGPNREKASYSDFDSMNSSEYSGQNRKPMIDQLREELAVNKQKQ